MRTDRELSEEDLADYRQQEKERRLELRLLAHSRRDPETGEDLDEDRTRPAEDDGEPRDEEEDVT